MSVKGDIELYIGHFRGQLSSVREVDNILYRKILFVSMLDCLARSAFPGKNNRDRFVSFVDRFSQWQDKDRVSCPQLKMILERENFVGGELHDIVSKRLSSWPDGRIIEPTHDYLIRDLTPFSEKEEKVLLKKTKYTELLFTYRNHLVHEFREPGRGGGFSSESKTPYYVGFLSADPEGEDTWELDFPVPFIDDLCQKGLAGLEAHLTQEGINPYDSYQFGTLWASNR
jgi:hypothetical protein